MLKLTDDDDDDESTTSPKLKSSLVKSEPHQNGHQNSESDVDDDANVENNDEDDDDDDDDDDTKFKLATPPSKNDIDDDVKRNISLSSSDEMATTVLLPPLEMSIDEQRVLGYMPLRDDFEREYKNDAETLLSNLSIANQQLIFLNNTHNILNNFNGGDDTDAIDFYLKLTLIKMYRECLCERGRFKKIARDYGLINNATALINSHARVMSNHTMYYNSSLVYFNHKTANSYYNSFNFILNNPSSSSSGINNTNNNGLMSTYQHNSNGTNGQYYKY